MKKGINSFVPIEFHSRQIFLLLWFWFLCKWSCQKVLSIVILMRKFVGAEKCKTYSLKYLRSFDLLATLETDLVQFKSSAFEEVHALSLKFLFVSNFPWSPLFSGVFLRLVPVGYLWLQRAILQTNFAFVHIFLFLFVSCCVLFLSLPNFITYFFILPLYRAQFDFSGCTFRS